MRADLRIERLDATAADDAVLGEVHELLAAAHAEANAAEPYRSPADTAGFLRHPATPDPRLYWTARAEGALVGFMRLGLAHGYGDVVVRADARRRGIGTALLDAAVAESRRRGLRILAGTHGTPAGAAFAERVGAAAARRDVRSLLNLTAFAHEPRPVAGYRVLSWIGSAPAELVDSYADARLAANDAPSASPEEWEPWDVARLRAYERALEARGRDLVATVALAGDEVVGFTDVHASRAPGSTAATEDTAVVAAHRGRGLGRWIKTESLLRLRRERPEVRLVTTTNAEQNEPMLAVNASLGFERTAVYTTCVLEL
jgi:GNAT superfamily N-acetyltransferase